MNGSWQQQLQRQAREAHERAIEEPQPWWVTFSEPCEGIFSRGVEQHTSVAAVHVGMRVPPQPTRTDTDDVTYWRLDGIERLAVGEQFMRGFMQAVRYSMLHGTYRKAGTEREYRF